MAKAGDYYDVEVMDPHSNWGIVRNTNSRDRREGEAYIKIPATIAYDFGIYNSAGAGGDILGKSLFNCSTADGLFSVVLRAEGNQAYKEFAKQFAGDGNLKAVGDLYRRIGAHAGDTIRVTWTSESDIVVEKL